MSREKLTESLLAKRDARAREIWQDAEQRAVRYRQQAEARCTDLRRGIQRQYETELTQQLDATSNRIEKKARRIRLLAEETFLQQLHRLAIQQIAAGSATERLRSLQRLAAELPLRPWQQITVHPADRQQAAELFPDSHVETDPALLGGLVAVSDDAAVRVDNSLNGRLEQYWQRLSGSILDSLRADRQEGDA